MNLAPILRAAHVATLAHGGQKRKYTNEPYVVHVFEVASIVSAVGGTEDMICAAILHDTLEDTEISIDELSAEFGDGVVKLIIELTDVFVAGTGGNRVVRKAAEATRYRNVSSEAKTIKLADLISNTSSIVDHDPDFGRIYLQEKELLLDSLRGGNGALWNEAHRILEEGKKKLQPIATGAKA